MKTPAPSHTCNSVLVLLTLLAALQATPVEKKGIDIYSLTVDSKVSSRFAHTVVTSQVVNRANTVQDATFQMELPKKAFITNFSMVIDGVTYPGNIKEQAVAQEEYNAAVASGQSAGLVKTTGRKMEQFQVSVSVAPAAKISFELVYEELLKRQLGVYELLFKIRPQQLVKHMQMDIHIFEPQGIRFLETESTFMTKKLAEALTTSRNDTKAHIHFKPSLTQQQKSPEKQETVLDGSFIVRYDVNRTLSGGCIQIENGYFVHHFAPEGLTVLSKNVVFVIDKSGSMSGRKIKQTQEALIKILGDLRPKDQFSLVTFDSEVSQWKPSLLRATDENVQKAKKFAERIQANGGTDINRAMTTAVQLLDSSQRQELLPTGSVSLIILLTDGDPTSGEINPAKIQRNVQKAIESRYSLFCLGFGFDVSYTFLEKLALDNGGLARRIYEDSDSALQLQDFFQEVANPLMTRVAFEYPSNAVESVTQENFRVFFEGSEIVVAGKLRDQSPDVLSAKVKGQVHQQNLTFQTEASVANQEEGFRSPKYIFHNFMERLWAYLTIQQLLEQSVSASKADELDLKNQALSLSLYYSFVTPLTSMVVTKPEGQEHFGVAEKPKEDDIEERISRIAGAVIQPPLPEDYIDFDLLEPDPAVNHHFLRENLPDAAVTTSRLIAGAAGPTGGHKKIQGPTVLSLSPPTHHLQTRPLPPDVTPKVVTTAPVSATIQAPDVILPLPGQGVDQLCVDISHSQGLMYLLSDPHQEVEVAGQFENTQFLWIEVAFKNPQVQVHVSPERVVVTRNKRSSAYEWKKTLLSVMPGLSMTMEENGILLLSGPGKVTIGLLHWEGAGAGLRLLLQNTHYFSNRVHGILGQFYRDVLWKSPEAEDKRTLTVQGHDYLATRKRKLDYQEGLPGKEISCWSVDL